MRKFEWERKPSKKQPTSKENATIIRALNNFGRVPEQHELLDGIENLQQELQRKDNIINELKKHIGEEWYCYDNESIEFKVAKDILDKINELEGEVND